MNKVIGQQIAVRLRQCRLAAGLTQGDVARDFLISRQAVSCWERGETLPTVGQLYEIGLLYGASLDFILYGIKTVPVSHGAMLREVFRPHAEFEDSGPELNP